MTIYNVHKNYKTWNVALWIYKDEDLHRLAMSFNKLTRPYEAFVEALKGFYGHMTEESRSTPDGVEYNDPTLDKRALNKFIKSLNNV